MQKAAGVDVFTDGEYRRGNFMADLPIPLSVW
jgi:methionine synthase II (cobalamin-independent)